MCLASLSQAAAFKLDSPDFRGRARAVKRWRPALRPVSQPSAQLWQQEEACPGRALLHKVEPARQSCHLSAGQEHDACSACVQEPATVVQQRQYLRMHILIQYPICLPAAFSAGLRRDASLQVGDMLPPFLAASTRCNLICPSSLQIDKKLFHEHCNDPLCDMFVVSVERET